MGTKKVIEQGKGYLGVQYLTKTISVYQRFGLNPKGVFILIDKPKAREVALAICPELESEIAEKDKEIEEIVIKAMHTVFQWVNIDNDNRVLGDVINDYLESLNK